MSSKNKGGPISATIIALLITIPIIGIFWWIMAIFTYGFISGTVQPTVETWSVFMAKTVFISAAFLMFILLKQVNAIGRKLHPMYTFLISLLALSLIQVVWFINIVGNYYGELDMIASIIVLITALGIVIIYTKYTSKLS